MNDRYAWIKQSTSETLIGILSRIETELEERAEREEIMRCPNCGTKNTNGETTCRRCGYSLVQDDEKKGS